LNMVFTLLVSSSSCLTSYDLTHLFSGILRSLAIFPHSTVHPSNTRQMQHIQARILARDLSEMI
jgi:hypothetical protein